MSKSQKKNTSLVNEPLTGPVSTILVHSDEHGGDKVRINAADFDEEIHTKVVPKREKLKIGGKKVGAKDFEKKSKAIKHLGSRTEPISSPANAADDEIDAEEDKKKK